MLTTHYIEEAEEIADRVAVINGGKIILIEEKNELMKRLGTKQLCVELEKPMTDIPKSLIRFDIQIENSGSRLLYRYDASMKSTDVHSVLAALATENIVIKDLQTYESSLEDIFVDLVAKEKN